MAAGRNSYEPFDVIDWKVVDEGFCVRSKFISSELSIDNEGFYMTGDRVEQDSEKSFILKGRI